MSETISPAPRPLEAAYLPTLDGWRAIAIVAVMVSHAQSTFRTAGMQSAAFYAWIAWGRLGVDLFFALSGFLICNRLLREAGREGGISLWSFYVRRAFRILPLYSFYLAALFGLSRYAGVPASGDEIKHCVFFYRNYVDLAEGAYTNHFWSLSVEEHFYLLWPLFLVLAGSGRALWLAPVLAVLVGVWRSFDAHFQIIERLLPHTAILWRTDTRIDALLWGCFAALVCFRWTVRLPAWSTGALLLALIATVAVPLPGLFFDLALIFPLLIVSTVSRPDSLFGRVLEWPFLRWIGRLSYSLYVWQTLFLQHGADPDPAWLHALKQWPWNVCSIFVLAVASHYLLEQPMIRLGRFWLSRPIRQTPPAVLSAVSP